MLTDKYPELDYTGGIKVLIESVTALVLVTELKHIRCVGRRADGQKIAAAWRGHETATSSFLKALNRIRKYQDYQGGRQAVPR